MGSKEERDRSFVQQHPLWTMVASIVATAAFLASLAAIWAVSSRQTIPEVVGPLFSGRGARLPLPSFWLLLIGAAIVVGQWLVIASFLRFRKEEKTYTGDEVNAHMRVHNLEKKLDSGDFFIGTSQSDHDNPNLGKVLWREKDLDGAMERSDARMSPLELAKAHNELLRSSAATAIEARRFGDQVLATVPTEPIRLEWLEAPQESPQGLHLRVTNQTPKTIPDFRLHISDVKLFQKSSGQFVPMRELHDAHGSFVELQLAGEKELFPDHPTTYPVFRRIDEAKLQFQGHLKGHTTQQRHVEKHGLLVAKFRCKFDGEQSKAFVMCFRWDGSFPQRATCPFAATLSKMLRRSALLCAARAADKRNSGQPPLRLRPHLCSATRHSTSLHYRRTERAFVVSKGLLVRSLDERWLRRGAASSPKGSPTQGLEDAPIEQPTNGRRRRLGTV